MDAVKTRLENDRAAAGHMNNGKLEKTSSTPGPWAALQQIASQLLIISDAQFSIWKLKLVRMAMLAAVALPLSVAFVALLVYGFVLLDRALGIALALVQTAPWVSPLVRGGLYFVLPAVMAWIGWHRTLNAVDRE